MIEEIGIVKYVMWIVNVDVKKCQFDVNQLFVAFEKSREWDFVHSKFRCIDCILNSETIENIIIHQPAL